MGPLVVVISPSLVDMIEASSTPLPRDWGLEDGAALRRLREAAGVTQLDLARRAALSVAQVRELEEGGHQLFYSPAIQLAAGRRLFGLLGGERPQLEAEGLVAAVGVASASTVPPVTGQLPGAGPQSIGLPNATLADPVPIGALPRGRPSLSPWALGAMGLAVALLAFQAFDSGLFLDDLRLAGGPRVSVPEAAQAPADSMRRDPGPAATTTAGPAGVPTTLAAAGPATGPSPKSVTPAQAGAVTPPVAAREPVRVAATPRDACDPADREPLQVQATVRLKPANYVHLVAERDAVVCVLDAQAQRTRLSLEAGQARSVYGAPPWRLLGKDLAGVQVYFQGYKIPVASLEADFVQLTESSTE